MSGSRVLRSTYLSRKSGDESSGGMTTMKAPDTKKRTATTAFANTKQFSAKVATAGTRSRRASMEGGRPQSAPPGSTSTRSKAAESQRHINVFVRVRPLSDKEKAAKSIASVEVVGNKDVYLHEFCGELDYLRQKRIKARRFTFDTVFDEGNTQEDVFVKAATPLVDSVLQAKNACCFCYGATGAGKTHTMLGTTATPGVMVLALRDLFSKLEASGMEFAVRLSYLEVYNEHVKDLLTKMDPPPPVRLSYLEVYNEHVKDLLTPGSASLSLREDSVKGVTAAGLTEYQAKDAAAIMGMLQKGNKRRTTEPTRANQVSSRSHAILQVMVEMRTGDEMRHGKLSLIDLAGSERALATDARTARSLEGANINKSLLSLSSCISALVAGKAHIPFRNSKLTQLLKDSLGGTCLTSMIANISPSHLSLGENTNTLHWADRAKMIRSEPIANESINLAPPPPPKVLVAVPEVDVENEGAGEEGEGAEGRGGMKRLTRAAAKAIQSPGAVKGRPSRAELRARMEQLDSMVAGMSSDPAEEVEVPAPAPKVRRVAGAETARESRRMTVANDGHMEAEMKALREQLKTLQENQKASEAEAQRWKKRYEEDRKRQEHKLAQMDAVLKQKDEIIFKALPTLSKGGAASLGGMLSPAPSHVSIAGAPAPSASGAGDMDMDMDMDMANMASPTMTTGGASPMPAAAAAAAAAAADRDAAGCQPGCTPSSSILGNAIGRLGRALPATWQTTAGLSDIISSVVSLTPGRSRPATAASPAKAPFADVSNKAEAERRAEAAGARLLKSPPGRASAMRRPSARFDASEIRALGL